MGTNGSDTVSATIFRSSQKEVFATPLDRVPKSATAWFAQDRLVVGKYDDDDDILGHRSIFVHCIPWLRSARGASCIFAEQDFVQIPRPVPAKRPEMSLRRTAQVMRSSSMECVQCSHIHQKSTSP